MIGIIFMDLKRVFKIIELWEKIKEVISLWDTLIEKVDTLKYLGIIIDDKLQFKNYCDYMLKKIGKKISFLNRIDNFVFAYIRCIIYKSIIVPHFVYCGTLIINMDETQLAFNCNLIVVVQYQISYILRQYPINRSMLLDDLLRFDIE